jgi:cytochrome P450
MTTLETTPEVDRELTRFFSADPATIAWPYPMYRRWQQGSGVVHWDSGPATVVTRHRDVKAAMNGEFPFISNGYRYGSLAEETFRRLPLEQHEMFFKILDFESLFMSRQAPEDHARLRRISARAFTARRIEALRESIQRHVDDLVDDLLAAEVPDVKKQLGDALPVRVICDLLGVPQQDRKLIFDWSGRVGDLLSPGEDSIRRADEGVRLFREYIIDMVDRVRRTGEGPELTHTLIDARSADAMSEDELVAMYLLILFGGSETTTNLLGNGFLALQQNRDQWDRLVADPSLVRGSIDELMRYDSPHHYLPRVAVEDVRIGDRDVPAGETVIIVQGAANRDPDVFDDPDTLDITRPNRAEHLSLAFGVHYCLGAALARLEGEIVFETLVRRFPEARLVQPVNLVYGGSAMLRAIESLPTDLGTPAW